MNYRHAFHAGNHADVLKHVTLLALLESLARKDAPFFFLDTHAGRARYDLDAIEARRSGEADAGIRRLAAVGPGEPLLARYLAQVRAFDAGNEQRIRWYPGSPCLAAALLRAQDRAALVELEPEEAHALRIEFGRDRRIAVHERDGYEALGGLLPPREKRGLVLIDPPYEDQERELARVAQSLAQAFTRWPQGIYAAWYPIKVGATARRLHELLAIAKLPKVLAVELCVHADDNRLGLNGSGLVIVNAPWQLDATLAAALPVLHGALSPQREGRTRVAWIAAPA